MTKLLIVESPAKAKTINKYLGNQYVVSSSVGHIRDLPKSNKKAIDIEGGFIPFYEIIKGKEKVIKELKDLAKKSDEIILSPDPDREGEAIAWHLFEILKSTKKPIKRVTFNEITENAIKEALKNPRDIDNNLKTAQEARRVLDRLFGYDLSGLIWKKVRYGLSAGRVQSPALRILAEREREINAFIPEDYWVITANVKTKASRTFSLKCVEESRDKKQVEKILKEGNNKDWKILGIKESEQKRSPRAPFTTSTLQQAASSRLGYTPSRTMSIAQKLYEAGHITYMRTDSTTLSKQAQAQILDTINKKYGKEFVEARIFKTKSKNAQEAHEAVRPTNANIEATGINDEQIKLYKLIWQRTISSQMSDAKLLKSKIISKPEKSDIPDFAINGSRVLFEGWLAADPQARGEDVDLPEVKVDEEIDLIQMNVEDKQTQPPQRYSEAGLVKELEKRGIGRPSTYASTIKTIIDRGYAEKINTALHPTDTGEVVSTFLENHFGNYISDSFTAEMENELDEIAEGKREYKKTLENFYTHFSADVKSKENIEKITNLGNAPSEFKCPKCENSMVIKLAKNGKFMSCSKFPDCNGARTINGEELTGPKEIGEDCPKCKDGKLIERDGKFGRFVSCNNYPKCKFIKKSEEEEEKSKTGVNCTECKNGEMTERHGRFGLFYSCSNYPDCKFSIKAKPTGNLCPICKKLMMQGTKTIPERCCDKICPNHRPDKLIKTN